MKTFDTTSINKLNGGSFWFEAAMCSTCRPAFDLCEDNYEVEDVLRKEGVLLPANKTDTESSALVVLFSSKKSGEAFLDRLNTYLAKKGN
jgi:hypothetical protein